MTPQQIDLVQRSWMQVFALRETAATMFYDRLFALDPALRPLFKDPAAQATKLFDTLDALVTSLDDAAALTRLGATLGASHAGYGVTPAHYDTLRAALMWTLQASLGTLFSTPVREAWEETYRALAGAMQAPAPAAPPA
ncbi:MAG: globin domain-containing protein [Burkholderiales bacterium]